MKTLFLWARPSGYMAACWRALAATEVEVAVVAAAAPPSPNAAFQDLDYGMASVTIASEDQVTDTNWLSARIRDEEPDVLILSGWWNHAYSNAVTRSSIPFVLCSDNPHREFWRAPAAGFKNYSLLRAAAKVAVPGERGFQYMTRAGVDARRVTPGLYGVEDPPPVDVERVRAFLFAGQMIERKGFDLLLDSFERYRYRSEKPFDLWLAGQGPLAKTANGRLNVETLGFVQPAELHKLRAKASALVMPSRSDAWPLSLVEGALAGLGLVCTSACGSAVEVARHGWNAQVVSAGDVEQLTLGLLAIEQLLETTADLPQRSRNLAKPFTAHQWAIRWVEILKEAWQMGRRRG